MHSEDDFPSCGLSAFFAAFEISSSAQETLEPPGLNGLPPQLDALHFGTQSHKSHWPLSFAAPTYTLQCFTSQRLQDTNATKSQTLPFHDSQRFSATKLPGAEIQDFLFFRLLWPYAAEGLFEGTWAHAAGRAQALRFAKRLNSGLEK